MKEEDVEDEEHSLCPAIFDDKEKIHGPSLGARLGATFARIPPAGCSVQGRWPGAQGHGPPSTQPPTPSVSRGNSSEVGGLIRSPSSLTTEARVAWDTLRRTWTFSS